MSYKVLAKPEVEISLKFPNHNLILMHADEELIFTPNASLHSGIKIAGDYYFFKYGFKVKETNLGEGNVGNNSYQDFKLGFNKKNFETDIFYKRYKGFNSNESDERLGRDSATARPDLTSSEFTIQSFYAFNRDYRFKDTTSGAEKKIELSYSWLMQLFFTRLKVRDPSGLVQGDYAQHVPSLNGLVETDLRQVGLGLGYGVVWPFHEDYYTAVNLTAGTGYERNKLTYINETFTRGLTGHYTLKLLLGSHYNGVNFGVKSLVHSSMFTIADEHRLTTVNYSVYLYIKYLF